RGNRIPVRAVRSGDAASGARTDHAAAQAATPDRIGAGTDGGLLELQAGFGRLDACLSNRVRIAERRQADSTGGFRSGQRFGRVLRESESGLLACRRV